MSIQPFLLVAAERIAQEQQHQVGLVAASGTHRLIARGDRWDVWTDAIVYPDGQVQYFPR